ncbi:hypothetical protein OA90_21170 [Labrenzia sp. OB1]|nr:hypothetical protein OA90_21170 [Labrenzia sp. OB1]
MMEAVPLSVQKSMDDLFDGRPLVSHAVAARFIGVHAKTLTRWGDDGLIFYRLRGARRAYAKEDIAAAITGPNTGPETGPMRGMATCQSSERANAIQKRGNGSIRPPTTTSISSSRSTGSVVDFMAQLERRQKLARKSSKTRKNDG